MNALDKETVSVRELSSAFETEKTPESEII